MNIFLEINKSIGINLNEFVIENNMQGFIGFFSDAPIFFLPIFLLGLWIFHTYKNKNEKKKKILLKIFYSSVLSMIANLLIQQFFHLDRPESIVTPIIEHIPDASFPSDHAAVSFGFLFALFLAGYRKIFYSFMPFVIIMNFSRLAGGIHWFFDIFVGMIIGLISAIIIMKILKQNKYINHFNNFVIKIFKKINF